MGFSADWLALREPADHAARDARLLRAAAGVARHRAVVVDLGCGTGSTRRAFGDLLADARWRMVDGDALLLARAGGEPYPLDLNRVADLPLAGASLVTASALIDLVSAGWIDRLVARLAELRLPFYAALSYDGRMDWTPALAGDGAVTAAFNRHQRSDKGFGPALGPEAAAYAADRLRAAGYAVATAPSDWVLGAGQAALQAALLPGIAAAAAETGVDGMAEGGAAAWRDARLAAVAGTTCRIGHLDLLALPAQMTVEGG
jgi:hypothetical protein